MSLLRDRNVAERKLKFFDITETVRHSKGHTIYKVVFKDVSNLAVDSDFLIWKRYNDFKRLHHELLAIHRNFYLRGKFPSFAKARFFGRYERDVIDTRKNSALQLLIFASEYPILSSSLPFSSFFENAEKATDVRDGDLLSHSETLSTAGSILLSSEASSSRNATNTLDQRSDADQQILNEQPLLGGVWNYRRPGDDVGISSDNISSDDEDRTTFTDSDSVLSTPLPSVDLSVFDPLYDSCSGQKSSDIDGRFSPNQNAISSTQNVFNFPDVLDGVFNTDRNEEAGIKSTKNFALSSDLKEFDPINTSENNSESLLSPLSPLSPTAGVSSSDIQQYLFDAASVIGQAQQHEVNLNYEASFHYYKIGINILLGGVQNDTDVVRRDSVRKKISQYLCRSENIYKTFLADDTTDCKMWNITTIDPVAHMMNAPTGELQNFKVLGVIDKVMLVLDTTTEKTYVIKTLHKSCGAIKSNVPSIVPTHLPFMLELFKVYETDYALFLLLEHASGGRLWTYVSSFIQTSPMSPIRDLCPISKLVSPIESSAESKIENVYAGHKFVNTSSLDVGDDDDDLVADPDLHADKEYPSSYIELFTNYASSKRSEDNVGLAKCRIKPSKEVGDEEDFLKLSFDTVIESGANVELNVRTSVDAKNDDSDYRKECEANLIDPEANDLICNARALLSNVSETLELSKNGRKTDAVLAESETRVDGVVKIRSLSLNLVALKQSRRRSSQVREPFASPTSNTPVKIPSSIGGSFENLSSVGRGVMQFFKECDDRAKDSSAYLPEKCVRSWAAELATAVANLHLMGILCKDLRPDNVLLGEGGHVRLTYFSQWNCVEYIVDDDAVDNLYCAPEISNVHSISSSADWWSYGALLYELLTGRTLVSCHPGGITSHTPLHLPSHLTEEAKLFLGQLLTYSPYERLGHGCQGFDDVQSHPFFADFDWNNAKS